MRLSQRPMPQIAQHCKFDFDKSDLAKCAGAIGCLLCFVLLLDKNFSSDETKAKDIWLRIDKVEHIVACLVIQVCSSITFKVFRFPVERKHPARYASGFTICIGLAKELCDGPRASLRDFAADLVGIIFAIPLIALLSIAFRMFKFIEHQKRYEIIQEI
uniref:VanZ-like domain-containing protein n=1 Tax=Aplanochytrium stocchinoi TaxID=215587 RepID=A0A6S8FR67_9STRA|mmetsp:Transcript_192/g.206  ORF Transcript_192/g.206 Transcript_192/m.206 type:complete len:159 (-) Transcript_192:29-505(-)